MFLRPIKEYFMNKWKETQQSSLNKIENTTCVVLVSRYYYRFY